jgi:hypothetical protein
MVLTLILARTKPECKTLVADLLLPKTGGNWAGEHRDDRENTEKLLSPQRTRRTRRTATSWVTNSRHYACASPGCVNPFFKSAGDRSPCARDALRVLCVLCGESSFSVFSAVSAVKTYSIQSRANREDSVEPRSETGALATPRPPQTRRPCPVGANDRPPNGRACRRRAEDVNR